MPEPKRIQLSRAKDWRMPANTVKVTRPGAFGNPWSIREAAAMLDLTTNSARYQVIDWFTDWINSSNDDEKLEDIGCYGWRDAHRKLHARLPELRGKNLACWCPLDSPCHADVLLKLANQPLCEEAPPCLT